MCLICAFANGNVRPKGRPRLKSSMRSRTCRRMHRFPNGLRLAAAYVQHWQIGACSAMSKQLGKKSVFPWVT
jgi:hypothetical protein